jgi:hypothetical protein
VRWSISLNCPTKPGANEVEPCGLERDASRRIILEAGTLCERKYAKDDPTIPPPTITILSSHSLPVVLVKACSKEFAILLREGYNERPEMSETLNNIEAEYNNLIALPRHLNMKYHSIQPFVNGRARLR